LYEDCKKFVMGKDVEDIVELVLDVAGR